MDDMMRRIAAGALLTVMTLGVAVGPASADTMSPIGRIGGIPTDSTDGIAFQWNFQDMDPVEAFTILVALMSADARQDMSEMLDELDASRLTRDALRDAESLLRGDILGCPRCWPAG